MGKLLYRGRTRNLRVKDATLDRMTGECHWDDGICEKRLKESEIANHEVLSGRKFLLGEERFSGRGNYKYTNPCGRSGLDLLEEQ